MSSQKQGHQQGKAGRKARRLGGAATHRRPEPVGDAAAALQRLQMDPDSLRPQDVLQLQRTIGNQAVGRLLAARKEKMSPVSRKGAQARGRQRKTRLSVGVASGLQAAIQRAIKLELQTSNRLWRNDGVNPPSLLPRKYGPSDSLVRGATRPDPVRLESEEGGMVEFETEWFSRWSDLRQRLLDAIQMTKDMDGAEVLPSGRKKFPFNVARLRRGTAAELKRGVWKPRRGREGTDEKILGAAEQLEVEIRDGSWTARIQVSESFELSQYESYLKQHKSPVSAGAVIGNADDILAAANTKGIKAEKLVNLRNLLLIIVEYIQSSKRWLVKDKPSKFALELMSRTHFASIYGLLSKEEKKLFREIVKKKIILTEMGMDVSTPFFPEGYGSKAHHDGPKVHQWLKGIPQGKDLLSVQDVKSLSAAMGRFNVQKKPRKGEEERGLLRFEARSSTAGVDRPRDGSDGWEAFAFMQFLAGRMLRKRKQGTGGTGLEMF